MFTVPGTGCGTGFDFGTAHDLARAGQHAFAIVRIRGAYRNFGRPPQVRNYRSALRLGNISRASASAMRPVIGSGAWQLRHMPGPNEAPWLGQRASMTDEPWVDWDASATTRRYDAAQRDFG